MGRSFFSKIGRLASGLLKPQSETARKLAIGQTPSRI